MKVTAQKNIDSGICVRNRAGADSNVSAFFMEEMGDLEKKPKCGIAVLS